MRDEYNSPAIKNLGMDWLKRARAYCMSKALGATNNQDAEDYLSAANYLEQLWAFGWQESLKLDTVFIKHSK